MSWATLHDFQRVKVAEYASGLLTDYVWISTFMLFHSSFKTHKR